MTRHLEKSWRLRLFNDQFTCRWFPGRFGYCLERRQTAGDKRLTDRLRAKNAAATGGQDFFTGGSGAPV